MDINEFKSEMEKLVEDIRESFFDDEEYMTEEYIDLTVGADANGWNYQTGDNSYTGGAYGFRNWAVVTIEKDADAELVAQDIVNQLFDCDDGLFDEED